MHKSLSLPHCNTLSSARPDPSTRLRSKHRLASEALAKDGLKGFLRALKDILRQAQDERAGKKLHRQIYTRRFT